MAGGVVGMMKTELIETADGSHTLYVPEMAEHYHSVNGAIRESRHVFIDAGFRRLNTVSESLRVLEFGFGTGLNALLTMAEAEHLECYVHYYTMEKYPLSSDVFQSLNYARTLSPPTPQEWFDRLHEAPWETDVQITPHFVLHKIRADYNDCCFPGNIQLVYYDAFAPDKQPEVWNERIFAALFQTMLPGGLLTTYCAKGIVRRMLQAVGFTVERIPGPPGKREMLRAVKPVR